MMTVCVNHENVVIRYDSDYKLCDNCLLDKDFPILKLKTETIQQIEESHFSDLVQAVYKRPYSLQQSGEYGQNENVHVEVLELSEFSDEDLARVSEDIKAWVEAKPPKLKDYELRLWWLRDNYPDLEMLVVDLTRKGHLNPGEYNLTVWW